MVFALDACAQKSLLGATIGGIGGEMVRFDAGSIEKRYSAAQTPRAIQ